MTDIWMVIDDVAGTPTNKKIEVQNFTRYLPSYIGFSQAAQALTAATGAVDMSNKCDYYNCNVRCDSALTLANGTSANQIKIITMITQSGTATLTPTTLNGKTSIAFDTDGDSCILLYTGAYTWLVYYSK